MGDLHISQFDSVPALAELNRISAYFQRYIALNDIESVKQTERLCRLTSLVPYAVVVHVFNKRYPLFVSPNFFDFVGFSAANMHHNAGRRYIETLYYSGNYYGMGVYALHFRLMPKKDVFIRWRFINAATGVETSLLSCSRTLQFAGNAPYVVLTILAPDALYAAKHVAHQRAFNTHLNFIMSLSACEFEVFPYLDQDISNKEIGERINRSKEAVRTRKKAIRKKLAGG